MTMAKYIVPNIIANPQMITSIGTAFAATKEHNVARISKQIADFQNKIYASKQKATVEK